MKEKMKVLQWRERKQRKKSWKQKSYEKDEEIIENGGS